MIWLGRSKAPTAYDLAWNRAAALWDSLGSEPDPGSRQAIYRELAAAHNRMAEAWSDDDVPGGYDGDFAADLGHMTALCWVLAASEDALACPRSEGRPSFPVQNIPGTSASSPLADAWEQFWEAGDRAERARLLRGHPGGPARRGERRQPTGIIPLLGSGHVGSAAVTGLLEVVADIEEELAVLAPQGAGR